MLRRFRRRPLLFAAALLRQDCRHATPMLIIYVARFILLRLAAEMMIYDVRFSCFSLYADIFRFYADIDFSLLRVAAFRRFRP